MKTEDTIASDFWQLKDKVENCLRLTQNDAQRKDVGALPALLLTVPVFFIRRPFARPEMSGITVIIDFLPIPMHFAILALLLIVGLRPTLLRKPLKSVFGLAACLLLVALTVSRAFPNMAPAMPLAILALGMIGLRFTGLSMVLKLVTGLVLLTLFELLQAVDSAYGTSVRNSNGRFDFELLVQCLVVVTLIVMFESKQLRPKAVVQPAK